MVSLFAHTPTIIFSNAYTNEQSTDYIVAPNLGGSSLAFSGNMFKANDIFHLSRFGVEEKDRFWDIFRVFHFIERNSAVALVKASFEEKVGVAFIGTHPDFNIFSDIFLKRQGI